MNDPKILQKNRKELVDGMLDKYCYLFCQKCEMRKCGRNFEVHHLIFRSEAPGHINLHHKRNLIIVGSDCHQYSNNSFHRDKTQRNRFVKERKLDELFGSIWGFIK